MLRGLFARASGERAARREAAEQLKRLARVALALPDDAAVTANEIDCLDPACPGPETIVLVMRPGERSRALKVRKPMEAVTEQDLRAALLPVDGG